MSKLVRGFHPIGHSEKVYVTCPCLINLFSGALFNMVRHHGIWNILKKMFCSSIFYHKLIKSLYLIYREGKDTAVFSVLISNLVLISMLNQQVLEVMHFWVFLEFLVQVWCLLVHEQSLLLSVQSLWAVTQAVSEKWVGDDRENASYTNLITPMWSKVLVTERKVLTKTSLCHSSWLFVFFAL